MSFLNPKTLLAKALIALLYALEVEKLYLSHKVPQLESCPSKI